MASGNIIPERSESEHCKAIFQAILDANVSFYLYVKTLVCFARGLFEADSEHLKRFPFILDASYFTLPSHEKCF